MIREIDFIDLGYGESNLINILYCRFANDSEAISVASDMISATHASSAVATDVISETHEVFSTVTDVISAAHETISVVHEMISAVNEAISVAYECFANVTEGFATQNIKTYYMFKRFAKLSERFAV
jgi:hypothetical protein